MIYIIFCFFVRRSISASVICGVIFYLQVFVFFYFFFQCLFFLFFLFCFCVEREVFFGATSRVFIFINISNQKKNQKKKQVSIRVLSTFNCVEYGGELYLDQDKQIKCFEGPHLAVIKKKLKKKKNCTPTQKNIKESLDFLKMVKKKKRIFWVFLH